MTRRLFFVAPIFFALATGVVAHRLDEYLQATIISVERDHVQASVRLIPGVAVSADVIASIDANADGSFSDDEKRAYAEQVLSELTLTVDGDRLMPRVVSLNFPTAEMMTEGLGEIEMEFTVELPRGGATRRLIFENHHRSQVAAYLVNSLVPRDPNIRVIAQNRNEDQSFYQLDYAQANERAAAPSLNWWPNMLGWTGAVGFGSMFRLGMRHIAEGTDHLLFLLALLLPASLVVSGSHWGGYAGPRRSLLQILRVVSAFTIGHSLTLALAAMRVVQVPSRAVEILIAVSILVSAIHAVHPLFPGREAVIAAFFGLVHGLAFATILGELGIGWWERLASILAFNLGIETMQLIVVAATMPSLVLLSLTRGYLVFRIGGALFAGCASLGWIVERTLNVHTSVDVIVNGAAHHLVPTAGALFLLSLTCRLGPGMFHRQSTRIEPLSTA